MPLTKTEMKKTEFTKGMLIEKVRELQDEIKKMSKDHNEKYKELKKKGKKVEEYDPDGLFSSALQAIKESGAEDPVGVINKLIDKSGAGDEGIADILDSLVRKQNGRK